MPAPRDLERAGRGAESTPSAALAGVQSGALEPEVLAEGFDDEAVVDLVREA